MTKEEIIEMAIQAGFFVREDEAYSPSSQEDHELTPYLRTFAKLIAEKERERIKEQNASEIEKTNAYIKQLEQGKVESDILHNEHLKLLGEIKAMTEAARSAEREECAKLAEEVGRYKNEYGIANAIRERGQE